MTRRIPYRQLEAQIARQRALEALNLMRRGRSFARAVKQAQTTPENMLKYVGAALRRTRDGTYRPTPSDHLKRSVRFLTAEGVMALEVRSSRTASEIARHWAAIRRYLRTRNVAALRPFRGQSLRVARRALPFVTDPRIVERLEHAGEVRFEELYTLIV
jgi:hypothetical protein